MPLYAARTPVSGAVLWAREKALALQQRLIRLLESGEPAYTIMVLGRRTGTPAAYESAVRASGPGPYADLTVTTFNRLALDMTTLFWPLVAGRCGICAPYLPPTLLTYDLAQLLMWRLVAPDLEAGAFADLRLRPQQIISQLAGYTQSGGAQRSGA